MNILIVCHFGLYQNLSFSFVHNQVREFKKLGHNVRVVIPNGLGKLGRGGKRIGKLLCISCVDGVALYDLRYLTVSRYGQKGFNTYSAIWAIRAHWKQIFSDFMPDVIHAHTLGFDSEIGAWLKERLHVPLVVTTHGGDTFVPFNRGERSFLKQLADHADHLVCVSSLLKQRMEDCGVSIPISVILNGAHLPNASSWEYKRPLSIIQAGYLIARKKADVTIRAFASLRERHPEASLDIVGSGSELSRFQALCNELGVADDVHFHGLLPNPKTLEKMSKAQFFVMPSVNEGFGIVYLEAMASRCVTIGTEGEGIADLIKSGENGFLVPSDNPEAIVEIIEWCLKHPSETSAIAERGHMDAVGLTWENNAVRYISLFEELIS